jgi:hypothetical protein
VQRTDPIGCERSTSNYPSLVAEYLGVRDFTDVSCSGAKTENMTVPEPVQLGSSPPQFDALTSDTDLVSLTISGDDIGFTDIAVTCAQVSVTDPFGDGCGSFGVTVPVGRVRSGRWLMRQAWPGLGVAGALVL